MSSSCRSGSVNSTASGMVTPGISPTVSTCASRPAKTSRYISCRNSWLRGPNVKCWSPGPYRDPGRGCGVRQGRVLADHVDDVHPEPVHAAVQPPPHHGVDGLADLGVLPVQVGLLGGEDVQVVLAGALVPGPGRAGEVRLPVGRFGARRARRVTPGRGSRHQYQSRLGLSRLDRDSREPRVLVGGVVHHQVHDQLHAAGVQLRDQLVQVGQRAEQRVDVLVVADVVAVVVHRRAVDRGHPHDVDAQPVQVVQVAEHAAQVADAVPVGVGEAPRVHLVDDPAAPVGGRPGPAPGRGLRTGQGGRWLRRLPSPSRSASGPPASMAWVTQWPRWSSTSPRATACSARVTADTWVRMSMQYVSDSTMRCSPRT